MYFLCAKEAEAWQADDRPAALQRRAAQQAFLGEHLTKWFPAFCQAVTQAAQEEFYRGLARLTQAYLEQDCHQSSLPAGLAESGAVSARS
jgi:TorA maturation chaperone TorD